MRGRTPSDKQRDSSSRKKSVQKNLEGGKKKFTEGGTGKKKTRQRGTLTVDLLKISKKRKEKIRGDLTGKNKVAGPTEVVNYRKKERGELRGRRWPKTTGIEKS